MAYEPRFYREWVNAGRFQTFTVAIRETDLQIRAKRKLVSQAAALAEKARKEIEDYIRARPEFLTSLAPLPIPHDLSGLPFEMMRAATEYDVGPMAAVAGAIAEAVGRGLLRYSDEIIVENGGDIFMLLNRPAVMALYSGPDSPFTRRLLIEVDAPAQPVGVATSSGTIGHSLSFGKADAVVTLAGSAALADAAATALCNRIKQPQDIEPVLADEKKRGKLRGVLAVMGKSLGVWGDLRLHAA